MVRLEGKTKKKKERKNMENPTEGKEVKMARTNEYMNELPKKKKRERERERERAYTCFRGVCVCREVKISLFLLRTRVTPKTAIRFYLFERNDLNNDN